MRNDEIAVGEHGEFDVGSMVTCVVASNVVERGGEVGHVPRRCVERAVAPEVVHRVPVAWVGG